MPSDFKPPVPTPDGYECFAETALGIWEHVRFEGGYWRAVVHTLPIRNIRSFAPLPGREWRKLSEAPREELLRVLVERTDDGSRFTINARLFAKGWWNCDQGNWLNADLRPLAWKPAESTELDWSET